MSRIILSLFLCSLLCGCAEEKAAPPDPKAERTSEAKPETSTARSDELPPCCTLPGRGAFLKGKAVKTPDATATEEAKGGTP